MVLPLMNMPLMVPATIMPLAGAGAAAPKGDSNSWGRPRPWPVPNTFSLRCAMCALRSVAMGLSGKMVGCGIGSARELSRQELAFCEAKKQQKAFTIYLRQLLARLYRLDTAKTPVSTTQSRQSTDRARSTPADDSTNLFLLTTPSQQQPTSLVLQPTF